ncbi:hypothetical protein [Flavobacterium sp. ov086]|uniref:hypothetical protein n=1 Tax=Flavobacterium sp. ov086 TaxID=1761785 RepID=UPI000B6F6BD5|nr:hypothetical protein [Flavobacterium sp. ov086]SNR86830.1 hypothetical protein SAMN04487979_12659 [Flavobacterium sp. ov086]
MKLSLDALKERAEAVASEELLNEIKGGNANGCHSKMEQAAEAIGTYLFNTGFGR